MQQRDLKCTETMDNVMKSGKRGLVLVKESVEEVKCVTNERGQPKRRVIVFVLFCKLQ